MLFDYELDQWFLNFVNDLIIQIQGKRDLDVEREVISWIETVTRKFAPSEKEIPEWLKDGVIICE